MHLQLQPAIAGRAGAKLGIVRSVQFKGVTGFLVIHDLARDVCGYMSKPVSGLLGIHRTRQADGGPLGRLSGWNRNASITKPFHQDSASVLHVLESGKEAHILVFRSDA